MRGWTTSDGKKLKKEFLKNFKEDKPLAFAFALCWSSWSFSQEFGSRF